MSILMMSPAGKRAYRDLVLAMEAKGANCKDNPEPWDGQVDSNGVETLPSAEEAARLCGGCPLLNAECREALHKGSYTFVAMNGEVVDKHKISGVDLFAPEDKED